MKLPAFYSKRNKPIKVIIVCAAIAVLIVAGLNLIIAIQSIRASAKITNSLNRTISPDALVMQKKQNRGCNAELATGINFYNAHDVICDYYGYKFYKSSGDYMGILTAIDTKLRSEGWQPAVSGSGCDSISQCLYGRLSGEFLPLGRAYYKNSSYMELEAFHRKDTLAEKGSEAYAQLKNGLTDDSDFIYGYIYVDSYFSYTRPLF
jgi:hypothetical protein